MMATDEREQRCPYEVLELLPAASREEVEAAYKRALELIDGDKLGGYLMLDDEGRAAAREEIETAFATLADEKRRDRYDRGRPSAGAVRFLRPVESQPPRIAEVTQLHPTSPPSLAPEPSEIPVELPSEGEINGQLIRRMRESRGMTITELSQRTKVSKAYLRAMEANDLQNLPARVFLRGFLTQIARVFRVDRKHMADGYLDFVKRFSP